MLSIAGLQLTEAPPQGFWRVARAPDPLSVGPLPTPEDLGDPLLGTRFASARGDYGVLYFGTDLECCFGETLARFRPDPEVLAAVGSDWASAQSGFMQMGAVPADWRQRRLAVRVAVPQNARFVDVEDLKTRQALRSHLAKVLVAYGYPDLDVSTIRGPDRRVTRLVSQEIHDFAVAEMAPIAGVRYDSRIRTGWEAWAVFDHVPLTELERLPITRDMAPLAKVAKIFGLVVH
ncbi:MAG: RES domain-containing protein [Actinobacteria bacterium]|nr:RES domain-containing protein [Actinomycetota bacterium]